MNTKDDYKRKMKEVTKDRFFATVGQMDVHPYPQGRYPYWSEWKLRDGRVIGITEDYYPEDSALTKCRYYTNL